VRSVTRPEPHHSAQTYTLRYQDEILRPTDIDTFESFEQPLA